MILSTVSVVSVPSEVMLLCAAPVTVAAVPVALPSRLATMVQTETDTTSLDNEASGTNVSLPAESSQPRKAFFAALPL